VLTKLKNQVMKKFFLTLVTLIFVGNAFAGTADLFNYDASKVKQALVNADVLDQMVSNTQATVSELNVNSPVLANFKAESSSMMMQDGALGIPSFWWGCILGWVGILVVYLVTEDKEETKKALWGCIVNGAVGVVIYIVYMALIIGAWSSAAAAY
jgi:hypothetical protein